MPSELFERYARIAAIAILAITCFLVLKPFVAAIVLAAVLCSATWPLYVRLRDLLRGRAWVAALLMSLLMAMAVIIPVALLAASLTDNVAGLVESGKRLIAGGLPQPPDWLQNLPLVGAVADAYWHRLMDSRQELNALLQRFAAPARGVVIATGAVLGEGILQMLLVGLPRLLLLSRRRGPDAHPAGHHGAHGRADVRENILETVNNTITGVLFGIVGTAFAQAAVALAGFLIAGVPNAFVLAAATFFLSMVPVGPPLIWGGAALWLAQGGADRLGGVHGPVRVLRDQQHRQLS